MKTEQIQTKAKQAIKQVADFYISDRPVWAKIACISGTVISLVGSSLLVANPVTLPAFVASLVPYSWYLTFGGNLLTLIFQSFKRKNKNH